MTGGRAGIVLRKTGRNCRRGKAREGSQESFVSRNSHKKCGFLTESPASSGRTFLRTGRHARRQKLDPESFASQAKLFLSARRKRGVCIFPVRVLHLGLREVRAEIPVGGANGLQDTWESTVSCPAEPLRRTSCDAQMLRVSNSKQTKTQPPGLSELCDLGSEPRPPSSTGPKKGNLLGFARAKQSTLSEPGREETLPGLW